MNQLFQPSETGLLTDRLLNTYLMIQSDRLSEFLYTKRWRQENSNTKKKSFCWLPANPNEKNFFGAYTKVQPEFTRAKVAIQ